MALRSNKVERTEQPTEPVTEPVTEAPKPETLKPVEEKPKAEEKKVVVKEQAPLPEVFEDAAPSLVSLKNSMDPSEFEGVFPRVTGKGTGLMCEALSLGGWIDMQVVSHSERTFVTPGKNLDDLNYLCRASYDHHTVLKSRETGERCTIDEYKDFIIEEYGDKGVKDPEAQLYNDIFGVIFGADKNFDKAELLNMVQVSISPTAVKFWKQFVAQAPIAVMRKQMPKSHQNCVRVVAEAATGKKSGKSYIAVRFEVVPPEVLAAYTIMKA